jgi:hypothetical protein
VTSSELRIVRFDVTDNSLVPHLADGRIVSVPFAWSWRLMDATPRQRRRFEIIGSGEGVHWPELDEDISARGMPASTPAPRPKKRASRSGARSTTRL